MQKPYNKFEDQARTYNYLFIPRYNIKYELLSHFLNINDSQKQCLQDFGQISQILNDTFFNEVLFQEVFDLLLNKDPPNNDNEITIKFIHDENQCKSFVIEKIGNTSQELIIDILSYQDIEVLNEIYKNGILSDKSYQIEGVSCLYIQNNKSFDFNQALRESVLESILPNSLQNSLRNIQQLILNFNGEQFKQDYSIINQATGPYTTYQEYINDDWWDELKLFREEILDDKIDEKQVIYCLDCLEQLDANLATMKIQLKYKPKPYPFLNITFKLCEFIIMNECDQRDCFNGGKYVAKDIQIEDHTLRNQGVIQIGKLLNNFPNLRSLSLLLTQNNLGYKGLRGLLENFNSFENLQSLELNLNFNHLKCAEIKILGQKIRKIIDLEHLHLSLNQNLFEFKVISEMIAGLTNLNALQSFTIDIGYNNITAKETKKLTKIIKNNWLTSIISLLV